VIGAITACRTAALGGHVERCDDCGLTRIAYNSCRNRHCGKYQGGARAEWLFGAGGGAILAITSRGNASPMFTEYDQGVDWESALQRGVGKP